MSVVLLAGLFSAISCHDKHGAQHWARDLCSHWKVSCDWEIHTEIGEKHIWSSFRASRTVCLAGFKENSLFSLNYCEFLSLIHQVMVVGFFLFVFVCFKKQLIFIFCVLCFFFLIRSETELSIPSCTSMLMCLALLFTYSQKKAPKLSIKTWFWRSLGSEMPW